MEVSTPPGVLSPRLKPVSPTQSTTSERSVQEPSLFLSRGAFTLEHEATSWNRTESSEGSYAGDKTDSIYTSVRSGTSHQRDSLRRTPSFAVGALTSYIRSKLIQFLGENPTVDDVLSEDDVIDKLTAFYTGVASPKLAFFYQHQSRPTEAQTDLEVEGSLERAEPTLFLADLDCDQLEGRCIYFIRHANTIEGSSVESVVTCGEVSAAMFDVMDLILTELYGPILHSRHYDWKEMSPESAGVRDCLAVLDNFRDQVVETITGIYGGVRLYPLEKWIVDDQRAVHSNYNKLALDDKAMAAIEAALEQWCGQLETIVHENDIDQMEDNAGPRSELAWWRTRHAKLNSIVEQLKGKEARIVLGVVTAGKSRLLKRWRTADGLLTDELNEAKDNVKYLTSLDHFIEPLYSGTAAQILESFHGLFTNLKMLVTIARHYGSPRRIVRILLKCSSQTITACKRLLQVKGKLLEQDPGDALESTHDCLGICAHFRDYAVGMHERLMAQGKSKRFDFSTDQVLAGIQHFEQRLTKVQSMVVTIKQFSTLHDAAVDGLDATKTRFNAIIDELKLKPYDVLDCATTSFDRDFEVFESHIAAVELSLRDYVESVFEDMQSTDLALDLLGELEVILQRESLRGDLQDKYSLIFQFYGDELEAVQDLYDKHKASPPLLRNMPPVSGSILWARQLLTRIEEPMQRFQSNQVILAAAESRKVVRLYNRVARTLIEFEQLWVQAWCRSVESSRAGLHATLIVRSPEEDNDTLCVNFDPEVTQLIREAKVLRRLGVEVPDIADTILMQESKFKLYHDTLHNFLQEYNVTIERIPPRLRPLMGRHLEELERVVRPGLINLTWQSMNIDAYLHRIHSVLQRVDTMVKQVQGLLEFNIDRNLKQLRRMILVSLPDEGHFTLEQFVTMQEADAKDKTQTLRLIREEVEVGLREVMDTLGSFTLESGEKLELCPDSVAGFLENYQNLFYLAMLGAAKNSLGAIKKRLASKRQGGFLFMDIPFFDVDVELTIPSVSLHPSLDDVQNAINESARLVLACTKAVPVLAYPMDDPAAPSYYSLIAADVQIVCSVLLLTGSVEGSKRQVMEYLQTFTRYEFLWTDDKHAAYSAFMKRGPDLEDFERELAKYQAIEAEIAAIRQVYNLGCMSLRSQSLKYSLKAEASAWKSQYAKNLHRQAKADMDELVTYLVTSSDKLRREVTNVDEVGEMVSMLKDLRARESDLEQQILPIESRYYLLTKYDVRLPKEETDTLAALRKMWKELAALGQEKSSKLSHLQAGFKRDVVKAVKSFALEVMQFCNDFDMNGPMLAGLAPAEALDRLRKYQALFVDKETKLAALRGRETLFGLQASQHEDLDRVKSELALLSILYSLHSRVEQTFSGFSEYAWGSVPGAVEAMTDTVAQFQAELAQLPRSLKEWTACADLERTVDEFAHNLPIISRLSHPGIRRRHWNDIFAAAANAPRFTSAHPNASPASAGGGGRVAWDAMKLKHVLALNPQTVLVEIEAVCFAAKKEAEIENRVQAIADLWTDQLFSFADHKNKPNAVLDPRSLTDMMENLEEALASLSAIASSKYSEALADEVLAWVTKLSSVSEVLEAWATVQSMWMYIEAVFCVPHVAAQLPGEAKRFSKIDGNYMKLMLRAVEDRHVVNCCCGDLQLKNMLPHLTDQLEQCQRSLTGYLEAKRAAFPRFYFVSDKVLLEMMSKGHRDSAFELHMSTIFEGIRFFSFEESADDAAPEAISFVNSRHFDAVESMLLSEPIRVQDGIEKWLQEVVVEVGRTIRGLVVESRTSGDAYIVSELIFKYPAQVCALALQLQWTKDSEDALTRSKTEKNIMVHTNKRNANILLELCGLLDNQKQSPSTRAATQILIVMQVHQKDRFDVLFHKRATSTADFDFVRQMRYSSPTGTDDIVVSMADVGIPYTFEYLGLIDRVVATPLTDRCFVALTQALGASLGGAVVGPTGTGKTETVKDLGRGFGRIIAIFNCTQQMDFRVMERTFKGLAASGAFGCFDEFNRIEQDVLSACAQQLLSVLSALRERRGVFVYTDGDTVRCDPAAGVFITMNPGYEGRQDLRSVPNLQLLFRTFAMATADKTAVLTVKLMSYGFQNCARLASKIGILFDLCQVQLCKQPYYDFSMRNINAIVHVAASMIREQPDKPEVLLLLLALREVNLPRFDPIDKDLFLSFMSDLFPEIDMEQLTIVRSSFDVSHQASLQGYDANPVWVEKANQIHKTCQARHGVIVVGPARCGKSSILDVLFNAEKTASKSVGVKVVLQKMNPKCQSIEAMYGRLDATTNQWKDGVFTYMWRRASMQPAVQSWLLLDGPIDMQWMENLNTVLDDNKILTLANGDRIAMTPGTRLLFETSELVHASPAVISRVGIVYVEANAVPWRSITARWLATRAPDEGSLLATFVDKYVETLMTFVAANCTPVMMIAPTQIPVMLTSLYDSVTKSMDAAAVRLDLAGKAFAEKVFIFCAVWSIGGLLEGECRVKLSHLLSTMTDLLPKIQPERQNSASPSRLTEKPLPNEQATVYDYYPDDYTMEWEHWRSKVPEWSPPLDTTAIPTGSVLVPTFETSRFEGLARGLTLNRHNILVVGSPASTKSSCVRLLVNHLDPMRFSSSTVCFTSASSPQSLIARVNAMVEKKQARMFAPEGGRTCLLVVEDVSHENADVFGDKGGCELVRQLVCDGGCHDSLRAGEWRKISAVQYMAVMTHPKSCYKDISDRLKGALCPINVSPPRHESVVAVFSRLALTHFEEAAVNPAIHKALNQAVEGSIKLNATLKTRLAPSPSKSHYTFNLHDTARIFRGICQAPPLTLESAMVVLSVWHHECSRVLVDKLMAQDDQETAQDLLVLQLRTEASQLEGLDLEAVVSPQITEARFGFFGHERQYKELPDLAAVRELLESSLEEHQVKMVLFDAALLHILRIARVLSMPRSSLLLVGVTGSGRTKLSRLATCLIGATFAEAATAQNNAPTGRGDMSELVRTALRTAGTKGREVCLVLSARALDAEKPMLDGLNQFLSTGLWPGLFTRDEMDSVSDDMRLDATNGVQSIRANNRQLYELFEQRAWKHLHLVLNCSPDAAFRDLISSFPALQRACAIDWILPWSSAATARVARAHLDRFPLSPTCNIDNLARFNAAIHTLSQAAAVEHLRNTQRHVYVTPRTFTLFVETYRSVFDEQTRSLDERIGKMRAGLEKLKEAGLEIDAMETDLQSKEEVLAAAQSQTAELLKDISASTMKAEIKKGDVLSAKNQISERAQAIQQDRDKCSSDLVAAQPALKDAAAALQSLSNKDFIQLKSYKNPSYVVKLVFDAMLLLMHRPMRAVEVSDGNNYRDSYAFAQQMMGDANFLKNVISFEKDEITDETAELLQPYRTHKDFHPPKVKLASPVAAALCTWVLSMLKYHEIARGIKPMMDALRIAEYQLAYANKHLQIAVKDYEECQRDLDAMQVQFEAAMLEKQRLQADCDRTKQRLETATALLGSLDDEMESWQSFADEEADELLRLPGDCAIASAMMVYLGPFNREARTDLLSEITNECIDCDIPYNSELHIPKFFTTDNEMSSWFTQGLPCDEFSIQSALMVQFSTRFPLLIDPQEQGVRWLKQKENPVVVHQSQGAAAFASKVEDCLAFGKTMLIENIGDRLDPLLEPVLGQEWWATARGRRVLFMGKELEWHPSFSLRVTSRLLNPHFSPELCSRASVVDFSVTFAGLEDQLLSLVVRMENPKLQASRLHSSVVVQELRERTDTLEKQLLNALSGCEEGLLEDEHLMGMLADTKSALTEVAEKSRDAHAAEHKVLTALEDFRTVATRASLLYFAAMDMGSVHPMYQVSKTAFDAIFSRAIGKSAELMSMETKKASIIATFTSDALEFYCMGYLKQHKAFFELIVATKLWLHDQHLDEPEHMRVLSRCGAQDGVETATQSRHNPRKPRDWISDAVWSNCICLSDRVSRCSGLLESIAKKDAAWRSWVDKECPELEPVPDLDLDAFHRLLLVRAMREDRVLQAARVFVEQYLGKGLAKGDDREVSALGALEATSSALPIVLCVFLPGADTATAVTALARRKQVPVYAVSMGQGQEAAVDKAIASARGSSAWVLLHNAHLNVPAVNALQRQLDGMLTGSPQDLGQMRVWITTEQRAVFSSALILMSVRAAFEPPDSLRTSMRALYADMVTPDLLEAADAFKAWGRLLYATSLCWCLLQQRGKFGAVGWTAPLELTAADWQMCAHYQRDFLVEKGSKQGKLSPTTLGIFRLMAAEVHLGGRVSDAWDRQTLSLYLQRLLGEEVLLDNRVEPLPGCAIPAACRDIHDFRAAIEELPARDSALLFGLGLNADHHASAEASQRAIGFLLNLRPPETAGGGGGGGGGGASDKALLDMAHQTLAKIPAPLQHYDKAKGAPKPQKKTPLALLLHQEVERMAHVERVARDDLQTLHLALTGAIPMPPRAQTLSTSLAHGAAPMQWTDTSWPAATLAEWLGGLQARHEQLQRWTATARPKSLWIGGLFNPAGLMTCLKQETLRKLLNASLDDLALTVEVQPPDTGKSSTSTQQQQQQQLEQPDSLVVHGLFLEGAAWSSKDMRLVDAAPKARLAEFPKLVISAHRSGDDHGRSPRRVTRSAGGGGSGDGQAVFACPCFTSARRTQSNLLIEVPMLVDSQETVQKWILRGAALLTTKT